jgi:GNAT superfamily N-acetyltransferase
VSLTPGPGSQGPSPAAWRVRAAEPADVVVVAASLADLLLELGTTPPTETAMRETARALLEDPDAGVLLVAAASHELIGVLAASWQIAMHVPGRYGLIQDLWVERRWRGRGIGAALLGALEECARGLGVVRLEVGLPTDGFAGLGATTGFYRASGFDPLGQRMRRLLA